MAFESTEDIAGAGGGDHFRALRANIGVDPTSFFQMAGSRAVTPAISQDGSRIAFASKDDPLGTNPDGNSEIFLFDGAKLLEITKTSPASLADRVTQGNFQPSISDDGRFIAFSSNRDLVGQNIDGNLEVFVYDATAGAFAQLTKSSGVVGCSDAKISGDGSTVAFIRDNGTTASASRDLMKQSRVGPASPTLLAVNVQSLAMTYGRAISDDGLRLVYAAQTATNTTQVFLFDGRAGGVIRQITSLGARVAEVPLHPTISGDGSRIAFAARRSISGAPTNADGGVELYVYDLPTSTFSKITNAPSSASADVVSSLNDDGTIVAFSFARVLSGEVTHSGTENNSEIYATAPPARPPNGTLTTILNHASFGHEPSSVKASAPDSIAVAQGTNLAGTTLQSQRLPDGSFPTNVAGTRVAVNGRAAQIFFVSPTQVIFLVPPQTETGTAEVVVTNAENFSSRGNVPTLPAAPGVFTKTGDGIGEGQILNGDTLQEGPFDPTGGNLRLSIFATGARNAAQTVVSIGGRLLNVDSVMPSASMPGLDEVHVRAPADFRGAGTVNLSILSDGRESNPVNVTFTGDPSRAILVNEVLADPPDGVAGDANHDGVRDGTQDEFIEFVNGSGEAIGVGAWTIKTRPTGSTTETTRFTFPVGTSLAAGQAVVVFGGGSPAFNPNDEIFGCAQVFKIGSSSGLSLTNTGLTILIRDGAGNLITQFSYGGSTGLDGNASQSLTRSPDINGSFVLHTAAPNANGRRFSPGLRTDGVPLGSCPGRLTSIELTPPATSIVVGTTAPFTARALDQYGRTMTGISLNFVSDNTNVAKIESVSTNDGVVTATFRANNPGTAHITASGTDGRVTVSSHAATLTITGPSLLINDMSLNEGNAGTTTFTFTVSLSSPAPATVAFDIATQDNTATAADNDYVACSLTSQTIPAGQQTYSFDVAVNGDVKIEPNETFFVNVSNVTGASVTDGQGVGTIISEDIPALSINDVSIAEGNGGTSTATFTVMLSPAHNHAVTVDYSTANSSAIAGSDYQATNNTLTFNIGETSRQFSVIVNGDKLVEPDETFFVNLTNATGGATIGDAQGIGIIQNDDTANLVISQIFPGGGLTNASFANDFVELFNRGPSAVDFAVTPYSVQFLNTSGSNWVKTDLTSGIILPGRYFLIKESSGGANGSALPAADATGSINLTSTTAGKVALIAGPALLTGNCPGDDGSQPLNPVSGAITDFVGYLGTSSTVNHCFEGSGPASFTSGNNTIAEFRKAGGCTDTNNNTGDFFTATPVPRNSTAATNNCAGGAAPNLSIDDVTVTEGNSGTTIATFTVGLSAPAQGTDVSFDIATQDNTATTADHDYVGAASSSHLISAGQTTFTFSVTVNGDTAIEPDETFIVNVTNVLGANVTDSQGVGTIQHDDIPTLSIDDVSATEGDGGTRTFTFHVSLSAPAPATVSFDIATADDTATVADNDYFTQSTIGRTIAAGASSATFDVTVKGDTNIEWNETFFVNIANVSGAIVLNGQGLGTIQNDDSPVLNIDDVTMTEGDSGTKVLQFTVTSTLAAPPGGITFDIATSDGTAQDHSPISEDNDYVARSLTGQTIPAGLTTYTFEVTLNGDKLVEPNETFNATISNPSGGGATIGDGAGVGTIQNDDTPLLVISQLYGGGNNSGATFQNDFVEIFNRGTTTVSFAVTPYSIQYASAAGSFSGSASNFIALNSGSLMPGQYFLVKLAGGTTNGVALPTEDASNPSLGMSATDGKVALVPGTTVATTAGGCPTGVVVSDFVGYGTANCSETAAVAALSATRSALRKNDGCTDIDNNANDFTTPTLSSGTSPRNSASAINDCNAPPTLTIDNVSASEGNAGTQTYVFTVSLSKPALAGGVSFDIATQDDSATAGSDYVSHNLTSQTIPADQQTYSFNVTVNGDTAVEPDETFFVNVTNVSGATVVDSQGVGTILNDDTPSLSINDVTLSEGNGGTTTFSFTVTLSPASNQTVTVNYVTADGSATAPSDYNAISSTQLTFLAGETAKPISVTVNGDTTIERDETFTVSLSGATNANIGDTQGLGTITNDDGANVVISQVYAGGGNTGTQYTNDFVEILNRTSTALDVSNWSIQTTTGTGTTWTVTRLCPVSQTCTIGANKYYLIQLASGGAVGAALPTPDATGTPNLAVAGAKVALVTNTTALNGSAAGTPPLGGAACPNANLSSVMDFFGFGTATCFEGGAAAAALTNTTAAFRANSGCTDTNANSTNFSAGAPSPRNSASAIHTCP